MNGIGVLRMNILEEKNNEQMTVFDIFDQFEMHASKQINIPLSCIN